MTQIELLPYIPSTGSYKITYPKHFIINEDADAIVTITSPETYSNLTITGYQANLDIDEKVLTEFLYDCTEDYMPLSDIHKEITKKRLYLERKFKKDIIYWTWWALAEENQIIIVSVNSEEELSSTDYNLYRFMLNQMEIYPSSFED